MGNQNPNPEPPAQFPIPSAEPLQSVQSAQPTESVQPAIGLNQPIIQTPTSDVPQTPKPFYKRKIFIIAAICVLVLILLGGGVFAFQTFRKPPPGAVVITQDQYKAAVNATPIPIPSFVPSTIAPIPTIVEFRNPKLAISQTNQVSPDVAKSLGVIPAPNDSIFVHTEVYKGIPIKWTAGQPIPADRLQWLKNAIDKAPDFYTKAHPPTAIISMTFQEAGMTKEQETLYSAFVAAANGTNIFLWPGFVAPNSANSIYAPIDEKMVRSILMHEWMHIAQYYESVDTLTDDYLTHVIAGLLDLGNKSPFIQNFGFAVGWYFKPDWATPSLKDDVESQKTTQYGSFNMYEDMADTAGHVITCDTSMLSQARINKMAEILGRSAQSFCQ